MPRLVACCLLLLFAAPALARQPSFDCASAATPVEKAICADPALAEQDAAIARIYRDLLQRLPPAAADALKADQRTFLAVRDRAFGLPDRDLAEDLSWRRAFLEAVEPTPRSSVEGLWGSVFGLIEVTAAPDGGFPISVSVADPVSARWICETEFDGIEEGGMIEAQGESALSGPPWELTFASAEGLLQVTETPPAGADTVRGYCGHNGFVQGSYLPLAKRPE